ncbi:hypothetical protein [Flavobacterium sp. UBA7682]|uniref:hypothetical protein n=1 Tax=Flavobacterium sp. UBA7682 TaxID=1946560 RepID=UPI0025C38767|nr:hypothetical protein [Flavobacterium sp. UBA7682]
MKNLFLILVLLFAFASCNKEPKYETKYLDANLKAALNNKPGSYWIFKDSVSGELDSVYLVANELKIDGGYTTNSGFKYEKMHLYFDSKHIGKDTSYNLSLDLSVTTRSSDNNHLSCGLTKFSSQPLYLVFFYPFSYLAPVNYPPHDTIVYTRLKEPLLLAGSKFDNVCVFSQYDKTLGSDAASTGYWSDAFGLVKMRFVCFTSSGNMTKVLELQRWKILK